MNSVTGGDLYSLWSVANVSLPRVAKVYTDANSAMSGTENSSGKFEAAPTDHGPSTSPIYPYFENCRSELQHILAQTATNILDVSSALNLAIKDYEKEDTTAADQFKHIIAGDKVDLHGDGDAVQIHDPNDPSSSPPTGTDKPGKPDEPDYYDSPGDDKSTNPTKDEKHLTQVEKDINNLKDK
ncbi:MAG TPA: hypothetical protein VE172_21840 [Stackebrandtia sp.]|jgi:hypothetical protein|uniref:hypothetical protein n=1 Tax=Stackebrandtia sp. TaxID=2023065 RepID=UPI002D4E6D35|nr:hypothetical protein [Stackebrandtia sp.]HZE41452.1 hypothetical protein [Stackebrandtia sp.]